MSQKFEKEMLRESHFDKYIIDIKWHNNYEEGISKEPAFPKLFSRMSKTLALVHRIPSIYLKGGYVQEWGTYIVILSQGVGELYC